MATKTRQTERRTAQMMGESRSMVMWPLEKISRFVSSSSFFKRFSVNMSKSPLLAITRQRQVMVSLWRWINSDCRSCSFPPFCSPQAAWNPNFCSQLCQVTDVRALWIAFQSFFWCICDAKPAVGWRAVKNCNCGLLVPCRVHLCHAPGYSLARLLQFGRSDQFCSNAKNYPHGHWPSPVYNAFGYDASRYKEMDRGLDMDLVVLVIWRGSRGLSLLTSGSRP